MDDAERDLFITPPSSAMPDGWPWRPVRVKPGTTGYWYGVYIATERDYDVILVARESLEDASVS